MCEVCRGGDIDWKRVMRTEGGKQRGKHKEGETRKWSEEMKDGEDSPNREDFRRRRNKTRNAKVKGERRGKKTMRNVKG